MIDAGKASFQEIFNYVAKKILEQGRPAVEAGSCRYRADDENGLCRCAMGWLIPDDKVRDDFEDVPAETLAPRLWTGLDTRRLEFIGRLQRAHDYAAGDYYPLKPETANKFKQSYIEKMLLLASDFGLSIEVLH